MTTVANDKQIYEAQQQRAAATLDAATKALAEFDVTLLRRVITPEQFAQRQKLHADYRIAFNDLALINGRISCVVGLFERHPKFAEQPRPQPIAGAPRGGLMDHLRSIVGGKQSQSAAYAAALRAIPNTAKSVTALYDAGNDIGLDDVAVLQDLLDAMEYATVTRAADEPEPKREDAEELNQAIRAEIAGSKKRVEALRARIHASNRVLVKHQSRTLAARARASEIETLNPKIRAVK